MEESRALARKKEGLPEDSAGDEEVTSYLVLVREQVDGGAYSALQVALQGFLTNARFWLGTGVGLVGMIAFTALAPMLVFHRASDLGGIMAVLTGPIWVVLVLGPCVEQALHQRPLDFVETWSRWIRCAPGVTALLGLCVVLPFSVLGFLSWNSRFGIFRDLAPFLLAVTPVLWAYAVSEYLICGRSVLRSFANALVLVVSAPFRVLAWLWGRLIGGRPDHAGRLEAGLLALMVVGTILAIPVGEVAAWVGLTVKEIVGYSNSARAFGFLGALSTCLLAFSLATTVWAPLYVGFAATRRVLPPPGTRLLPEGEGDEGASAD